MSASAQPMQHAQVTVVASIRSITCYSTSNVNHDKSELRPNTMEFMSSLQNGLDELKPSLFGNKYSSMTDLL